MKDSKVARLLKCLCESDLKRLRSLVRSPFFRIGRDLTPFFETVIAFHPSYDSEDFTAEHIYSKLYPDSDYDNKTAGNRIRVLSSELHSVCKEYLIQKGLEEDGNRRKYYLLEKLRELKLHKEFIKEFNTEFTGQDDVFRGGVHEMLSKFYLEHSMLEFNVDNHNPQDAFDSIVTTGEYAAAAALILGFRNADLKQNCIRWNCEFRDNLLDDLISCIDTGKFIGLIKSRNDKFSLGLTVNYLLYEMFSKGESSVAYYELKKLIGKYLASAGHHEKYFLLNIMLSYCARKQESPGNERFLKEEFEVVSNIVAQGVYKFRRSDTFNPDRFRAFVLIASDNKESEWLEKFIAEHIDELAPEERDNMRNYAMGILFFIKNEFEKALTYFAVVEPTLFLFKKDIKHLRMKIFYEIGQYDSLYSLIDSSRHYARSSKELSVQIRSGEINFLNFLTELLRLKTQSTKADREELRMRIINELFVASKKWLLDKIDEMPN